MENQTLKPIDTTRYHLLERWHTPCFDNLNDLEWHDGFGVQSHGVRLGVRANDPEMFDQLRALMPTAAKPYDGTEFETIMSFVKGGKDPKTRTRHYNLVYQNHTLQGRSFRMEEALDRFQAWVSLSIGFMSSAGIFIHAGAVEWRGHAIVLPGRSLAGKSTLVSELLRAGARYLSDEYAILDQEGTVTPWYKPLSMRANPTAPQVDLDIAEFGAERAVSARPGLVVLCAYEQGAEWAPRVMDQGEAIMGMLDNCVGGRLRPAETMNALQAHTDLAPVICTQRSDAAKDAARILELLDAQIDQSG
ncbi:hypothetical protein GCM10007939_10330 [Amylibacter marinus]|uniref:Hpr(Ser) kinase/phosphatase n=1 Tax=Amylibacter marinus TaxID=1475483 RepID=A0ABQ5VU02_9RHOB|nr:hypothetical protein [Amylibacter marinus]GLQ34750.1 hypothetical protein GCM10007939_10330 [Amylibacter marinus]